ncbi:uncharacterized protein DS421_13g420330 [Arachis hypogaea]|nr:uncharacterized protein DS421_13g420330 [Arachis hypogaea]
MKLIKGGCKAPIYMVNFWDEWECIRGRTIEEVDFGIDDQVISIVIISSIFLLS